MMGRRVGMAGLVIFFVFQRTPSWAVGIALRFVDVTLENVQPGAAFNLRALKNLPMVVQNLDHEDGTDIVIQSVLPNAKEMKDGYEPIPDPSWIKILPDHFHLGPHASAAADILVSIPNDPKLKGHHYECILYARTDRKTNLLTQNGVIIQAGLRSRLRMSIGTMGPASLQLEKAMKKLAEINVNFTISPDNLFVNSVPLGTWVDFKKDKKAALKIINESDNPVELKVSVVPAEQNIIPQSGYENAPDPTWLKIENPKVKVEGNSIKEVRLSVRLPDAAEQHGKKYMFLIKTSLADDNLPLAYYNMVYVSGNP